MHQRKHTAALKLAQICTQTPKRTHKCTLPRTRAATHTSCRAHGSSAVRPQHHQRFLRALPRPHTPLSSERAQAARALRRRATGQSGVRYPVGSDGVERRVDRAVQKPWSKRLVKWWSNSAAQCGFGADLKPARSASTRLQRARTPANVTSQTFKRALARAGAGARARSSAKTRTRTHSHTKTPAGPAVLPPLLPWSCLG
jgi:hypothetical protein